VGSDHDSHRGFFSDHFVARVANEVDPAVGPGDCEPGHSGYAAVEAGPDILAFPFLREEACAVLARLAAANPSLRMRERDGYATEEIDVGELCAKSAGTLERALLGGISRLAFAFWCLRPKRVFAQFVSRYREAGVRGIALHHDYHSVVTISTTLNSDFTGGGCIFPRQGGFNTRALLPGVAVMFPGQVTHPHAVLPITSGERFAYTAWCSLGTGDERDVAS
jgi:hypothetical protein